MGVCKPTTFKELYFKWNPPLQRFLLSKGLDLERSADLVQDAFMKMWKNCAKVELSKAKSFLFTVANNLFIDDYRKQQTRLKLKQITPSDSTKVDGQYAIEMKEFGEQLEAAINSMSVSSREVFVMHRFNEMSYKEIAQQLDISVKAIEKRMSKALKHLADQMIHLKR